MSDKYRIDPDFVRPEPTPADHFNWLADPGDPDTRRAAIEEALDYWRGTGVSGVRITLTGPDIKGDETGYPAGIWLEGWRDEHALRLPFGAAWPDEDSAIWPPLTFASCDRNPEGEKPQALSAEHESAVGEAETPNTSSEPSP